MNRSNAKTGNRRDFLRAVAAVAATLALTTVPHAGRAASKRDTGRMKIGVIGSGRIGGTLGTLWVKADHEVLFSSRHPDRLKTLVDVKAAMQIGCPF